VGADPYVPADGNGRRKIVTSMIRRKTVVDGGQHHVVTDQGSIPDGNAALILETAAGVDEYVFPHRDVLSAVGVERREHVEAVIHRLPNHLGEQFPDFSSGVW